MGTSKKPFISFYSLILIFIIAESCNQNKLNYGSVDYYNKVEDDNTTSYIIKNDGKKVYGNNVSMVNYDISNQVSLDGTKYPTSEVKAFKNKGSYYIRLDNKYIKRIIHGKLNVYVLFDEKYNKEYYHSGTYTMHFSNSKHYAQRGEDGPLIFLANREILVDLVKDCPLSVSMIGDKGYAKLIRGNYKDLDYINNIFNVYNNGCKEDVSTK
jgi:hypothetical protein